MNSVFTAKLLQNLRNKKNNKGFTLIELLVVVIIIGVLAAVALPNLLAQVGKARETEGKNGVGTITRTQQTYHFENQTFADALTSVGGGNLTNIANNPLGLAVTSDYYTFTSGLNGGADSMRVATGVPTAGDAAKNGTRAYSSQMDFAAGNYSSIMCQTDQVVDAAIAPTSATACATGSKVIK